MMKKALPLTLVFTTLSSLAIAQSSLSTLDVCTPPPQPQAFQSVENVVYKDQQAFDMYLPQEVDATKPLPVALIIHGGAWFQGTRKSFDSLAQQLTSMGYAGVTVDYRLAVNAAGRFPAPMEDLRCAVKTLKSLKTKYNLNTDRIVTIGFSAGGHLAAELGLTSDTNPFDDSKCPVQGQDAEVQGVVGYYGPYDLTSLTGLNFQQIAILQNFLGGSPTDKPDLAKLASPRYQIDDEKIPFYLVQAANDDTVPVRSSREFFAALQAKNVPAKYVETTDGAHTLQLFDARPFANEATCGSIEYLTDFVSN